MSRCLPGPALILGLLLGWGAFLPVPPGGAADMPVWGDRGYPIHRLALTAQGFQALPLVLKSAKNQHLLALLELSGTEAEPLRAEIVGGPGAPHLDLRVYQLRPVPAGLPARFFWDGLIPLGGPQAYPGNPVRVLVSLKIGPEHPAGAHRYDLMFRNGRGWCRQPLALHIWNFSLPPDLPITYLAILWPEPEWFKRYGVTSLDALEGVAGAYLRSLREYKVNAVAGFSPLPVLEVAQGRPLTDFPHFTRLLDLVVQLGYRYFRLPNLPGAGGLGQPGNRFPEHVGRYYPACYRYLEARGWVDKTLVKVWDEPTTADFPRVRQAYRLIKNAVPAFRTECAGPSPSPDLAAVVDVWAVYSPWADPAKLAAARRRGQEIWLYANLLHAPWHPPTYQRLIPWLVYQHRFSGYLLWSVNYWRVDPWSTPPTAGAPPQHGDFFRRGTFYYPDPRSGLPWPTLRLESLRQGWQDYQYLFLLEQAARQGKVSPELVAEVRRRLVHIAGNLKARTRPTSWGELEALREKIGEALNKAAP